MMYLTVQTVVKNTKLIFSAEKALNFSAFQSRNEPTSIHTTPVESKSELKKGVKSRQKEVLTVKQLTLSSENNLEQDHGGEIFDDDIYDKELHSDSVTDEWLTEMAKDVYDLVERGKFNQGNKRDRSREDNPEPFSSWSSSEEALMKCEGLLAFQQLNGSKTCIYIDAMDTCSGSGGIPGAAERLSRFFLSSCSLSSCEALQ